MLLFSNGIIHTVDPSLPSPEAVLVGDDGRIAAVGARAALERPDVHSVDLTGKTLIPGFNDAHVHVSWLGMLLTRLVDTRIHVAPNIPAIIERLAARAQSQPVGSWVEGVGYNEVQLPEGRHLTRHDLDQASAAHPILVTRTCGHIAVANSLALHLAGIDAATPNPPGGVIVRDSDSAPTGILQETAMALVAHLIPAPGPDLVEAATRAALESRREDVKIGVLRLLRGVSWPTATVILHFCDKRPYPILDVRALWSLGYPQPPPYTLEFWLAYTKFTRELALRTGHSMRIVDRALWQYSRENQSSQEPPTSRALSARMTQPR